MKEISSTKAQNGFGSVLKETEKGAVTVTTYGKPVAVVVSYNEYRKLVRHNDGYWERVATEALTDGFLSNEEMMQWLEIKLKLPMHSVEDILLRLTKEQRRPWQETYEITHKMSKQTHTFMDTLSRSRFIRVFTDVMKLRNAVVKPSGGGFRQHDSGSIRVLFDFEGGALRLIYMDRR